MSAPSPMQISEHLRAQAETVISVLINQAVSFIEAQPLGSFLPMWQLNKAMSGVGALLNLKAIQDRMGERGCSRGIFIVKGPGGSPGGLLIIEAEAQVAVHSLGAPRFPKTPRQNGQYRAMDGPRT